MSARLARQKFLVDFEAQDETVQRETAPSIRLGPASRGTDEQSWDAAVDRFLLWKQAETPVGDGWLRRMRWELRRFPTLLLRVGARTALPAPAEIGLADLTALRRGVKWEKATIALHFSALRPFLAWAGNSLALRRAAWALPAGEPTRRRWLTKEQLVRLLQRSVGASRLLVGLEGLNGLRRVEVLRLRARDVLLDEGCLRVLGKGRNGGKWRRVPIHPRVLRPVSQAINGLAPDDRVVPLSRSGADALLRRAAQASGLAQQGIRISHHDLRRTFGRLAHGAGMDLVQLKNLYGHASLEMTVHYIGLDSDTMRAGLERLNRDLGDIDGRGQGHASRGGKSRRAPRVVRSPISGRRGSVLARGGPSRAS